MLVLAVNGSPNRNGNTAYMLDTALSEAKKAGAECDFIQVSEALKSVSIPYCVACSSPCEGKCYKGTALEDTFNLMCKADGIIIGSPVYFCTVSALLKGFWDKSRKLRTNKMLVNKIGGALAVGAARYGGQETTLRAIQDMMLCQGMTVVGDGYHEDDAGHLGGCTQKPSNEDDQGLKRARILARRICELSRATQSLRNSQ
ncbi:MAG: flavodoxin family protein [Clostridiales bacterium]|nr:flavodoxin family protein [Clostridiales bacterium]MCF8021429.1 flavodoxin family protein [Clostridiales bacterium]